MDAEELFIEATPAQMRQTLARQAEKASKRVRFATINKASKWIAKPTDVAAGSKMALNLFPDASVNAVLDATTSVQPGRSVLRGHIEGKEDSYFLIACQSNIISGSIFIPRQGHFEIRYAGGDVHKIIESDSSKLPECGVQGRVADDQIIKQALMTSPQAYALSVSGLTPGARIAVVDILVVYTAEAQYWAGGEEGMNTLIDAAVEEANMIYQNSRVNIRLRLAHADLVDYEESGNLSTDLKHLIAPTDGYLDQVAALRATYKADLVCLIVENSDGPIGIATVNSTVNNACSVVQRYYATGSYTFAHELGHNFGCEHDRPNAAHRGVFAYSYGWVFADEYYDVFGTVMSYPGERIPYFSNPGVRFLGIPTGVPETSPRAANNAKTLNLTAARIAALKAPAPVMRAPVVSIVSPVNRAPAYNGSNIVFKIQARSSTNTIITSLELYQHYQNYNYYDDDDNLLVSTNGPSLLFSLSNIIGGNYVFTARAKDGDGNVSVSRPVAIHVGPSNDNFARRQVLTGTSIDLQLNTLGATWQAGEPRSPVSGNSSVWYSWKAPTSGTVLYGTPVSEFYGYNSVYTQTRSER